MILLTGGTGFISGIMRKELETLGMPYRLLVSSNQSTTYLKQGESVNLAVSSTNDERGLRAALKDVDVVYYLAGIERLGARQGGLEKEVKDIELLSKVSSDLGVKRFFYLSYLGADRASAFGLMKAKGIAENVIINSGLNYTIIRASLVYGSGDGFTESLARLIRLSPLITLIPGDGNMLIQPLWVNDLVASLIWSLDMKLTERSVISVGGPEHLSFFEVMRTIAATIHKKPKFVEFNPVQLGMLTQMVQSMIKDFPVNTFWMDYLAENRVCALDSMPRNFGINPARFAQSLNYLAKDKTKRK